LDRSKVEGYGRSREVYQGDGGQGQGQTWRFRRRVGPVFQFDPSEIIPKFQQLKEVTEKHRAEAERVVKEAFKEILGMLRRKMGEAQKLVEKAAK
jgi:hypothetical protein